MSFFKSLATIILLLSFTMPGIAHENECSVLKDPISSFENEPLSPPQDSLLGTLDAKQLSAHKIFLYGSLSFDPGLGVSNRTRNNNEGNAMDIKIGAVPFIFDTLSWFPVVTFDYNWLYYTKAKKTSPYLSCGIGAAYIIPYIPLRAGIEFENGFVDFGAKMVLGIYPSPEIRGGFRINF